MRRDGMVRATGPKVYRRAAVAAGLGCLFLGLLAHRLQTVEPALISQAMGRVGPLAWLAAVLATWASFRAVAGYDLMLHRHLATGVDPARARRAGFAAIAIAQTVGMGVLSGALIRWRMLPELGLWGATRLSLAVAVSFLMAWAMLGALVLAALGGPFAALAGWGLAGAVLAILGLAVLARPGLPNLITLSRLLALAAVDCGAACLALWLLVPGALDFADFLPVFMIALGAGLVSGSPAGLGAFEITLLALLPAVPEAELLAGVVAWRIVYYAAPAVIGAGVALWPGPEAQGPARRLDAPLLAEGGLVAQGELAVHPAGFVAGRTAHGLVALSAVADPARFQDAARAEGCWPVLYKAGARQAIKARRAGMVVLPLAREAWLSPQAFRLDLPARAGLRRKLRRAEGAGVRAEVASCLDWSALAAINAAWARARGGEHGFSMGRFDPRYLAGQRLVVARIAGRDVGFASFHDASIAGQRVWTLDLLRPDPAAPDGTAHLMIAAAIAAAREAGVARLSLAAVPLCSDPAERGPVAWLGRRFAGAGIEGLEQFKRSFAPEWQRLYIAGPSRLALVIVGREIWRRVQRPDPLPNMSPSPRHDAEYEFASDRGPWQRVAKDIA